jgi:hypothetical protein
MDAALPRRNPLPGRLVSVLMPVEVSAVDVQQRLLIAGKVNALTIQSSCGDVVHRLQAVHELPNSSRFLRLGLSLLEGVDDARLVSQLLRAGDGLLDVV